MPNFMVTLWISLNPLPPDPRIATLMDDSKYPDLNASQSKID
jgi:hypothetical protein